MSLTSCHLWLRKSLEQPTGHWTVQLTHHVCCFHLWGCRFCHGLALSVAVSSPKCHEEKIMYEVWRKNNSWTAIESIANLTNLEHPSLQPWQKMSYARNPASLGTSSCSAARLIHTSKTSASAYITQYITLYSMFLVLEHAIRKGWYGMLSNVVYILKNVSCKTLVNHHLHLTIELIRLFHLQTIKCINLQSTIKYITQLHLKTAIVLLNIQIHQIHMFSLQPIFEKHLQSLEKDFPFWLAPYFTRPRNHCLCIIPTKSLSIGIGLCRWWKKSGEHRWRLTLWPTGDNGF